MNSRFRFLVLGLALLAPLTASAQTPTVSAISDVSLDAGSTRSVNVVAVSLGTPITLTASLPAFATLNGPTSGTGSVVTSISLSPMAANVGTFNASVTATSGALSSTENFLITVNAAGADEAPVVSAPALENATVGTMLTFNVTATDAEAITSLGATGLPSGATFSPNGTFTGGTLSWTPTAGQTGDYDVVFTAMNTASGSGTTHIHVRAATNSAPTLDAPASRTVTEGLTLAFTVKATDLDGDHVALTTGALPSGATATDLGNNTLSFSWQPSFSQSGSYSVTFNGDDAHGGTVSATTAITVNDSTSSCGNPPVLTAPATRTVTEGQTVAFTVSATDADGDHVALTTGALPSGATAVDQGNNTLNFSWQPNTSQSGTYTITFNANDDHCGTVFATTTITVLDSGTGGGGGNGQATVTLLGIVNTHNDRTCFRIKPVQNSFDVRDVNLSTVTLQFDGQSLAPVRTQVQTECDDEGGDDGSHDAPRALLGGGHGDGEDDQGDDEDCDDCSPDSCDANGIRACFSTGALLALFGDSIQDSLGSATIHFTLSDGTEIVATFQNLSLVSHGKGHSHFMNAAAKPNPLNPRTTLTFTLSKPGRVQVSVFDMQGRLVNKLLDENRAAGPQSLVWDGSNSRNGHVSSGLYFFRIQAPEGHVVQRVAVVK
jgi:flagellar hook assembly protein FlgD